MENTMNDVEMQVLLNQRALMKCELLRLVGRIDTEANNARKDLLACVDETDLLLIAEGK
jgi:hypothetical protein